MAFFLSIPKKRASSDITLGKLLKQHIEKQGLYKVEDFQEAINELDKLREDIRLVSEKRESVVDLYSRYECRIHSYLPFSYYCLMSSVGKRVNISEKDVRIRFFWYDIYKDSKTGTIQLLPFSDVLQVLTALSTKRLV